MKLSDKKIKRFSFLNANGFTLIKTRFQRNFVNANGFTLIELLLVVAILSILLVVVFAALNPAQRLQDTRNANRWTHSNQVLTAIHEYIVDNDGDLPFGLTNPLSEVELGTCTIGNANCSGVTDCVDLSSPLANYISSMPIDPDSGEGSSTTTGYTVSVSNGIITIDACHAEGGETIQVSR